MTLKKIFCNEIVLRYLGILFIGAIFPFFISDNWKGKIYSTSLFFSLFYTFLSWNGACLIIQFFKKQYGNYNQTATRLKLEIPAIIIFMFLINLGVAFFLDTYIFICETQPTLAERIKIPILASIFCLGITALYESVYIYQQLQESILQAQKFQTESLKSKFEVLKNQIDPHFLFNSLNTLVSIIAENQQIAVDFAEKLSQVYRYILQNKDKELVNLHTELAFVESYIFLLKIRFEKNLQVDFKIEEKYKNYLIPPLSLQILVENAIKHNIIASNKPLTIHIFVNELGFLAVKNNLQIKNSVASSNNIGLDNIIKRYEYLTKETVKIINNTHIFEVNLPLISVS